MKIQTYTQQTFLPLVQPTVKDIPFGTCFSFGQNTLMRVKPVQFLLNSTLVSDVINKGDCFVANLETGAIYIMKGDKKVNFINATLVVIEEKEN